MNKVLVTGCAGFIGFHLCPRLLSDSLEVVGIDNLNPYYNVKQDRLNKLEEQKAFLYYSVDVHDRQGLDQAFQQHNLD